VILVPDYPAGPAHQRLVSATAAAQKLGVDLDTLLRWHRRRCGPAGYRVAGGAGLAYRTCDIEAWQDRMAELQRA
jgi:hypothetical protein